MSDDQIAREYNRLLTTYQWLLKEAKYYIEAELGQIAEAKKEGCRFKVRHAILDLAEGIQALNHKLEVFQNFIWEPPHQTD